MEVHFTQDQEAQLAQIARRDGKTDAGELPKAAGLQLLEAERTFPRCCIRRQSLCRPERVYRRSRDGRSL